MTVSKALENVFKKRAVLQADKVHLVSNEKYSIYFGVNHDGKPTGSFYKGQSLKAKSYYFQNEEKRQGYTDGFINDCEEKSQIKAKRKAEEIARTLEVGDVLYSSWGYEQTNIDFYLVTDLVGKASVKIVEIAGIRKEDGSSMTGLIIPDIERIKGDSMVKRVRNGSVVTISSFNSASPAQYEVIAGCRIYKGYQYSSYA